jgi:methionyl-tRNA formyltransferase
MDTGPIYLSAEYPLSGSVTSDQLFDSLAKLGVQPVLKTLDLIERGEKPVLQSELGATRAYKLSKEEGKIDWNLDADLISRKINAFHPDPGAWSDFRGQVIKINKVQTSEQTAPAGALMVIERSIFVGTGTSALELLEVTPAGKTQMLATSWANGARLTAADSFQ